MWQLHDDTKSGKGYLRIYKDGKRVADVFPFAAGIDEAFVREQAARIVDQMNAVDMVASDDFVSRNPAPNAAPPAGLPNGTRTGSFKISR